MEITYKPFIHRHDLKRYGFNSSIWEVCKGCGEAIFGNCYGCERCKYWVCRSCYKLPPEIRHPFHKEHPLTLLFESSYERGAPRFNSTCQKCKGCGVYVFNSFYGCGRCEFWLCRSCYKLQPEMTHPFHKKHPLTLLVESPNEGGDSSCNACFKECEGFIYYCKKCKFKLDVKCATLIPTTKNHSEDEQRMFSHPHPLIPCNRDNKDVDFSCSMCDLQVPIKAIIYVCLDCPVIMDESCAQLIQQITHDFHPHPLALQNFRSFSMHYCNACGDFQTGLHYRCSECNFNLDVRCASLKPKAIENQLTFTHRHDLLPCDCDTKGNFSFLCAACAISIEDGTVYVCLECQLFLHKSCAELPPFIKHPFHSPHRLQLQDKKYSDRSCAACKFSVLGFEYWCAECHFAIDVACASLSYSTFKFDQLHHHPLTFFSHNRIFINKCICGRRLGLPSFRCVPCDFTLNLCCLPKLPHTIKHSCHDRHSLTLTRSPVIDNSDDDEDSEYYCDICEEQRDYHHPTYYCEECHYVAHLSCVYDEIHPSLEREWSLAEDEEIIMLQAEVDVLTATLETLKTKLDELKGKCAQHISDYQVGIVEMEIKKAFLSATIDDPAIAKVDEEIIMLQAEVDPLTAKLETLAAKLKTLTTKLDELKEIRKQHIKNYQVGVLEVEIKKTSTSAIAKADEEIIMLQADVDALKATVTTKVDHLKTRRELHIGIPSFGTKLSLDILDDSNEVAEEDSSVKSEEVEEDSSVKSEEDQESDGRFTTLSEHDKAIEAVKKKRAQLDTEIKKKHAQLYEEIKPLNKKGAQLDKEIEALKKKRARFISSHVRK